MVKRTVQVQSAGTLRKVTPAMIRRAVKSVRENPAKQFGASIYYDLIDLDGTALPPKAVFGTALSEVLGRSSLPEDFSAGERSICFSLLRNAGYTIVRKKHCERSFGVFPDEEESWAEGERRRVEHFRRERATGLAARKKAQFIETHGRLFCEGCGIDPIETYGEHGEACIEVHHRDVRVSRMLEGHRTFLKDLQCLCANCHRVVHRMEL